MKLVPLLRRLWLTQSPASEWADVRDSRFEQALPIDLAGTSPGAVRILAFFLPQFHRDAVNERAWGPGFTEWRNVTKARPLFAAHQQPKLPADLGFYNLTSPQAWREQQELSSRYGIEGFVLYHYWFAGVCPLEASLKTLLAHPEINQRFCLCWANESWTRRWDGGDEEVILGQDYAGESPESLADYLFRFCKTFAASVRMTTAFLIIGLTCCRMQLIFLAVCVHACNVWGLRSALAECSVSGPILRMRWRHCLILLCSFQCMEATGRSIPVSRCRPSARCTTR